MRSHPTTATIPRRRLQLAIAAMACAMFACNTGAARGAGGPAGLPGPPPGAGTGFPLPPPPGQAPAPQPSGTTVAIPPSGSLPGLLSGSAGLSRSRLKLRIACRAGGLATLGAAALGRVTPAHARYRCAGGRSTVSFALTKAVVGQINRAGSVTATVTFTQSRAIERLAVNVGPRPPQPVYWTSVFGLVCGAPGSSQAQLQAPNFTVTPSTTIDVRPWLAVYTSATGWQWLGTNGPNASRWYRWTATPSGVAEWRTPSGTIAPWTWSPIAVQPGRGTYVIAVFEAIYWYSHPAYVWRYAHSVPGTNLTSTYCTYG
jgi:hypothetical protein